ncbi:MAG: sigma-54-dependent Fis family transcriptional regulator [Deltaproteobacteria bacterium]|nr:MAG: sigma-54-dependent Fis family transcriptional regulator [Deltaproteobacteria bacterium]
MHMGSALAGLRVIRGSIDRCIRQSLPVAEALPLVRIVEELFDRFARLGLELLTNPGQTEDWSPSITMTGSTTRDLHGASARAPAQGAACDDDLALLTAHLNEGARRSIQLADRVACCRVPVLITGEPGTLRLPMARYIHRVSQRAGQFCVLSCLGSDISALRARLCGDLRKAPGIRAALEEADGGTLVLREVDALPRELQDILLDFLDSGQFLPEGGRTPMNAQVRVIATTSRPVGHLVEAGRFSTNLFHRLGVVTIDLPPLRERTDDLAPLSQILLDRISLRHRLPKVSVLAKDALAKLAMHSWPGNIRELESVLERACVLHGPETVRAEHLQLREFPPGAPKTPSADLGERVADGVPTIAANVSEARATRAPAPPAATLDEIEREVILRTWEATGRVTKETAERLGISVRKVQYRLKEWRDAGMLDP